jgi:acyl carrier protein
MCDQRAVIQDWLTTHLAEQLGVAPQDIDVQAPFTEYGLDSLVGVSITGDLEDWLGLQLSPTLLWDYSTIETLAWYLAETLQDDQEQSVEQYHHTAFDELSDPDIDRLCTDLLATAAPPHMHQVASPAMVLYS